MYILVKKSIYLQSKENIPFIILFTPAQLMSHSSRTESNHFSRSIDLIGLSFALLFVTVSLRSKCAKLNQLKDKLNCQFDYIDRTFFTIFKIIFYIDRTSMDRFCER